MRQEIIAPIDIEEALARDIALICEEHEVALGCSGTPVPDTLGAILPYVVVERTGGIRISRVVDTHYVSFDVYGKSWKKAANAANIIVGIVAGLVDNDTKTHYTEVDITTLPYDNSDPNHADIPRVTFAAQVTCRAEIQ